ncbi:MAG: RsmE family RNA methyltransferase [Ignavibacteriales bacterium]
MTIHEQNGYLILEHLSDIELYYTLPEFVVSEKITLQAEEFHHAVNVMRNTVGDYLHITDGEGTIYRTKIVEIKKNRLTAVILEKINYENPAVNIWICIPVLKNPDRLKFAFEKCVELGITNFLLVNSKHTISKKINPDKFNKTSLAAMKQSLRAFLPKIVSATFSDIIELSSKKILFDQNAKNIFDGNVNIKEPTYFLFGPEGGFDESEISTVDVNWRFSLSANRLRSETAVIKCASLLKL